MSETHETVSRVHKKIMTTKYFLSITGGFWGLCRHSAAQSVISSQANRQTRTGCVHHNIIFSWRHLGSATKDKPQRCGSSKMSTV